MATLKISQLHKSYGSTEALRGIDLDIPEGDFTVFVGPSGCGKSTLLRAIAGLEDINAGLIEIDGQVINDMAPRDRDIAMVFQNYALYPYMNVFENIAFGLRARKFKDDEINLRVNNAAEMLGLTDYLGRQPRQLSGGQRQRVAIGRAIVRDAKLYLFDEPLSNLDAQLREDMRSEIKRLHLDIRKTMIYVTHDQVEAMTLADRIVLLNEGKIEQVGTPLELFNKPVSRFVAGFLGSPSINFIPAHLSAVDGTVQARLANDQHLIVPDALAQRASNYVNQSVLLGIRPEHMRRSDTGDLTVTVDLLQPTGSRSYGTFQIGATPVVAELQPQDIQRTGETIKLAVEVERMLVIDTATDQVV